MVLAHGVAETQHPFVPGPAPPLPLRVPSCHHPQLPSIREDPSGSQGGHCAGGWAVSPPGNGVPKAQAPGGRCRPSSEHTAPLECLPVLPSSPRSSVPGGSLSLGMWIISALFPSTSQVHSISGVSHSSQSTMDTRGRHGASLACGSAASSSPLSFTSGAKGAPCLGYLSPLFCLPDCICLSIHPSHRAQPPMGPQPSLV